ncbi:bifunctional 2-polyprenyl-6-hydroxyphenol methylase/3-demethylubiquinol 3-O-methyltransferase UbiG [Aurantiacibacter aquimixticola]|uniref:Ubiquinone biosynthesis O-methyltransferase n=1 Tax=Aurantiacibacter aquimixticola TaxID=1958945 RepID=A0A419RU67_9SPHN|nr:bifunctional 2-polyprenyl-6-hydroxyphenol methylase/3-demethylubiquinol 3-O-methyltransferase UbiG [Aurantiacibacter aquimixticola]RJY09331.1 bifunctional 2-polyprenyl-6-hydroxyphenol methylase/3-demethylubiquinol 3-O-methyltransferase UbiG [Aurantiacibacter aquimixticola]
MSDATVTGETGSATIREGEAAHFGKLAREWWDPKGSSAMLHRLNPVRLRFVRDAIDTHWGGDVESVRPLAGKTALDVGCGAGLLTEPLARMGAEVTGVDAAPENTQVAALHADGAGLDIRYMPGELGSLGLGHFDLVTCMEVLEHVADKQVFAAQLSAHLAQGGLMVLSTPNRTLASRALLVEGAEWLGAIPRGTHHWDDFVTPEELEELLEAAGLEVTSTRGIAWSPVQGLHLSDDMSLNFIVTARHRQGGA